MFFNLFWYNVTLKNQKYIFHQPYFPKSKNLRQPKIRTLMYTKLSRSILKGAGPLVPTRLKELHWVSFLNITVKQIYNPNSFLLINQNWKRMFHFSFTSVYSNDFLTFSNNVNRFLLIFPRSQTLSRRRPHNLKIHFCWKWIWIQNRWKDLMFNPKVRKRPPLSSHFLVQKFN